MKEQRSAEASTATVRTIEWSNKNRHWKICARHEVVKDVFIGVEGEGGVGCHLIDCRRRLLYTSPSSFSIRLLIQHCVNYNSDINRRNYSLTITYGQSQHFEFDSSPRYLHIITRLRNSPAFIGATNLLISRRCWLRWLRWYWLSLHKQITYDRT